MWQRIGTAVYWLTWPGTWLLIRRTRRSRVLIMVGDELLVTKTWLGDGRWSLSGGGLHPAEQPADGAAREVYEETGIRLQPADLQPLGNARFHGNGLSYDCHYFLARLPAKPMLKLQRFEITAARWVRGNELTGPSFNPSVQATVRLAGLPE